MGQNVSDELCDAIVSIELLEGFIETIEMRRFTTMVEEEINWRDYYYFPISTSPERNFPIEIILGTSE